MLQIAAMAKILEVIVTSVEDAKEAELGGADRLELVQALELGGLTPDSEVVNAVLNEVQMPVRVMLRESASMSVGSSEELRIMQARAEALAKLPIDGIVTGFIKEDALDIRSMMELLGAAPNVPITFHRAFDELSDPLSVIWQLKGFAQIDRILTVGGKGEWTERKQRLVEWQQAAGPSIRILAGTGLCPATVADIRDTPALSEVHVGRVARVPQSHTGKVSREAVRALKNALE